MTAAATLVFPAFNSAHVIGRALAAVPPDCPVIVVDNASRDGTIDAARAVRPDATIVAQTRNGGFGSACNAGLRAATTPFAAVVNPDLFLAPDAVARCLRAAEAEPAVGLFGLADPKAAQAEGETPLLSGAFIMMRCDMVAPLGFFDEDFFMYFEDTDLCLRAAAAGIGLMTVDGAQADHLGDGSTAPTAHAAKTKAWLWGGACQLFALKHAAHPEGQRAARKLRSYRRRALLHRLTLRFRDARLVDARLAGAAAVRARGHAAMFDNPFAS